MKIYKFSRRASKTVSFFLIAFLLTIPVTARQKEVFPSFKCLFLGFAGLLSAQQSAKYGFIFLDLLLEPKKSHPIIERYFEESKRQGKLFIAAFSIGVGLVSFECFRKFFTDGLEEEPEDKSMKDVFSSYYS